jgi:hypothetical protein
VEQQCYRGEHDGATERGCHGQGLAKQALMSPRTFARQFAALTGTTPHQWLARATVSTFSQAAPEPRPARRRRDLIPLSLTPGG